ncbi:hypothetical protein LINPERHAP2_LOCUS32550 [Linum perenne]
MVLNEDEGGEGHPEQQQQDDLAAMLENQVNQAVAPGYPFLEQLKLTGFRFKPDEMSLLCHFLQKGNNLKTVAIFTASPRHWQPIMPDVDLFNQYHRPWMSSPNVRINIFSHSQEKQLYPTPHPKDWYKNVAVSSLLLFHRPPPQPAISRYPAVSSAVNDDSPHTIADVKVQGYNTRPA